MLVKILVGLVVIVGAIFIYAAVQPKDYRISREITINAPAEVIFPWINNSKKTSEWMPWASMDPQMTMTYVGPEEGVGAGSKWNSEGKMGVGSATVTESVPNQLVKTKLEYTKPFEGIQFAQIAIASEGTASKVKWSVEGENNIIGRVFCLFMNMDKMIGGSFEQGLSALKTKVEAAK